MGHGLPLMRPSMLPAPACRACAPAPPDRPARAYASSLLHYTGIRKAGEHDSPASRCSVLLCRAYDISALPTIQTSPSPSAAPMSPAARASPAHMRVHAAMMHPPRVRALLLTSPAAREPIAARARPDSNLPGFACNVSPLCRLPLFEHLQSVRPAFRPKVSR